MHARRWGGKSRDETALCLSVNRRHSRFPVSGIVADGRSPRARQPKSRKWQRRELPGPGQSRHQMIQAAVGTSRFRPVTDGSRRHAGHRTGDSGISCTFGAAGLFMEKAVRSPGTADAVVRDGRKCRETAYARPSSRHWRRRALNPSATEDHLGWQQSPAWRGVLVGTDRRVAPCQFGDAQNDFRWCYSTTSSRPRVRAARADRVAAAAVGMAVRRRRGAVAEVVKRRSEHHGRSMKAQDASQCKKCTGSGPTNSSATDASGSVGCRRGEDPAHEASATAAGEE